MRKHRLSSALLPSVLVRLPLRGAFSEVHAAVGAGWGYAFIGLVLSIVSLVFKRSTVGLWALGLSIFAFIWVIIAQIWFAGALHEAARTLGH
jgi:hypothetical protein